MPATNPTLDLPNDGNFSDCEGLYEFLATHDLWSHVTIVRGRFDETLPAYLDSGVTVAMAHCDCDVNDGVRCQALPKLMGQGGFIVFDDPLRGSCLGAFTSVEEELIQARGLYAEQPFPHLVYRVQPLR